MLKEERQQIILRQLKSTNKVLTIELSHDLEVSEDTIRRDLKELAELGKVQKVHGGAISKSLNPLHYRDRKVYAQEEKISLASRGVSLLRDGQVIIMDGGTTNLELARRIPPQLTLTIFTNSLPVASELSDHPSAELIFLGGKILKSAQVSIGPEVIEKLNGIRADLCFLGTRSIHHELGVTEIDYDETMVKRKLVEVSEEVVSMAIAEKLGTTQPYIIDEARSISILISSLDKRDPRMLPYSNLGIEIL